MTKRSGKHYESWSKREKRVIERQRLEEEKRAAERRRLIEERKEAEKQKIEQEQRLAEINKKIQEEKDLANKKPTKRKRQPKKPQQ